MQSVAGCGCLENFSKIQEACGISTHQSVINLPSSALDLQDRLSARLPFTLQKRLERIFSADFSTVRIHEGPQAVQLNSSAFALGEDIYFAPQLFRPDTRSGLELLGHELAHVVQQRQGRLPNPCSGLSIVQDPDLEAEADGMGWLVASHGPELGDWTAATIQPDWLPSMATVDPERSALPHRRAIIQRRFFIGSNGFSSLDGNIEWLAQKVFPYAATQKIGEVTQALTRLEFGGRRYKTFIKFLSALNQSILLEHYQTAEEVPKYLHHFWAGGDFSEAAFTNLLEWLAKANRYDWDQYILTDSVINASFGSDGLKRKLEILRESGSVIVDISQLPFASKESYLMLRKMVVERKDKSKLPYLSDLARYAQLLALGGVYVDVDVNPGTVTMSSVLTCINGIPQLGPCFRVRKDAEINGFFDPLEAVRMLGMVTMYSKDKNAIGNHFIVAPARNRVVAKANEIATSQVNAVQITNGGVDFLKAFSRLDGLGADAITASLPAWAMEVGWITAESDSLVD